MARFQYQSSRLFNFCTVLILTGLCVLLNSLTQINFHRLELPKNKPEFAATGFEAKLFNKDGQLVYAFSAESGNQFPETTRILMSKLQLLAFSESNNSLKVKLTSHDGWLDTKNQLAFLGESVAIVIPESTPQQTVFIYTNQVKINGVTKFADSSAHVRVIQGKSEMSGDGFSIDYERQIATIKSHVRAVYDTN